MVKNSINYLTNLQMSITPEAESELMAFSDIKSANGIVLYANNKKVPIYRCNEGAYWETEAEKGVLWLYYYGLAGHGYIEQNGKQIPIKAQTEDAVYTLKYKNAKGQILSYSLHIGTRINPETKGFLIYGSLYYNDVLIIESFQCDNQGNIKSGVVDNGFLRTRYTDGQLYADLDLSSIWVVGAEMVHEMFEDMNLWNASIEFNSDYTLKQGTIKEQKEVNGVIVGEGPSYSLIVNPIPSVTIDDENICDTLTREKLKRSFEALNNTITSITELYTLKAPNMEETSQLATRTLYNLAIYYVADKEYECNKAHIKWSDWFGLNKEKAKEKVVDINSNILNLVEGSSPNPQVQSFLEKYAQICLCNSYAASSDSTLQNALNGAKSRLTGQYNYCKVSDLCAYYLEGNGSGCLAEDPGYCIAIETINRYTYAKKTPGLIKYINDKNGNWAEKLYKQCNANLQMLRITTLTNSGSTELSHKSMMLTILDNQKHDIADTTDGSKKVQMTYGAAIYAKVFNLQLADLANSMKDKFKQDCGSDFERIMENIYGILWEELQKETSDYFSDDILKQFQEEQKKYASLDKKMYIESCIEMTQLSMDMISNGSTITNLIPKLAKLSEKPWAAYTAASCSIVFYATSILSLSTVFMNWSQTDAKEKAEAILTCIQGVANIALSVVKIINIRTLINPEATFTDKVNAALRLRFDGEEMSTIRGLASANGETNFENIMQDMAKRYSTEVTDVTAETARVSKATSFFRIAEIAIRAFNVLMMGFITVVAGIEIAEEVKSGGYNISAILAIVSVSLMSISFVCEAACLTLDIIGITCSVLPIISAAVAFIGTIFQIVSNALKKPINPLAEFIKSNLVPLLNNLTIPQKEWIEQHNKSSNRQLALAY